MENKKVEINYDKIRQDLKDLIREKLKGHDLKVSKIHEEIDKVLHQMFLYIAGNLKDQFRH